MGMTNRQTVVGKLNSGEFTEFVFALAAIAKQTNSTLQKVYENFDVTNGTVVGVHKGVMFFGDGKQLPPYMEFGHYIKNETTSTVKEWVSRTKLFVDTHTIPTFDTVKCEGGSSNKVDVGFYLGSQSVIGFSLKWGHDAAERSQSPHWRSVESFYGKFVDISEYKKYYDEQYQKFTIPAFRYSQTRGDWSDELVERGLIMQETVQRIEKGVADKFVNKQFDSQTLAKNLIKCYTGDGEDIVFVELKTGKYYTVTNNSVSELAQLLESATFSQEQNQSDSGKTRNTHILMNGDNFIHFRTTASADKAPGQSNSNLRRVKRQTYLTLNIPDIV